MEQNNLLRRKFYLTLFFILPFFLPNVFSQCTPPTITVTSATICAGQSATLTASGVPTASGSTTTQVFSTAGTFTWTAPADVTSVSVGCWGGGGAGGGAGTSNGDNVGGGGGGGAYTSATVTVVPGTTYNIVIGAAAVGGPGNGPDGVASTFGTGSTLVTGAGGKGGTADTGGGGVGGVGTYNGGNGGAGNFSNADTGGGGGGAGIGGAGGNGDSPWISNAGTGGAGVSGNGGGGAGGAGGAGDGVDGNPGNSVGGGGGGADAPAFGGTAKKGGNGGLGQVVISYAPTPSGGSPYTWSDGSTAQSLTASPTVTTSYTVTGTSGGCSGSAVGKITIGGGPTVTVTSATICAGQSATLTASGIAPPPPGGSPTTTVFNTAGTSTWTAPSGVTSVDVECWGGGGAGGGAGTSNGDNVGGGGGGGAYTKATVTVVPGTTYNVVIGAAAVGGPGKGPDGAASTFGTGSALVTGAGGTGGTADTGGGGAGGVGTYNGGNGGAGLFANADTGGGGGGAGAGGNGGNGDIPMISSGGTGGAGVSGAGAGGNGGAGGPGDGVDGNSGNAVGGGGGGADAPVFGGVAKKGGNGGLGKVALTYTSGGSGGSSPYVWSDASTASTLTASPLSTTSYTVTGTSGGCSDNAVGTITVSSLVVDVNSATICAGQSATLTASGASTYSWSPNTDLSATAGTSVTANPTADITYIVTGTTNGCTGSAQATVTINSIPSPDAGSDITICSGATGNIGAAATPGYSYSWSSATGLSSSMASDPTITLTNVTASPVTTSYTVSMSPAGCSSTDVVNITVQPKDDATFSYPSATVCQTGGTDPVATITGTAGGVFTFAPAGLVINSSTGLITLASSTLGTYTVTYSTSSACPDTQTFIISIVNVPDATFSYAGPYCQNETPKPLPTFPAGSSAGVFSASPGGLVFVSTLTGEVDLAGSSPNTYTVTNTISAGGGCPAATGDNTITINAVPVTTVDNQTVCGGVPATLTAGGATTYVWSDGSTAGTLTASPVTTTPYTVTGTTAGCSSSAVGTITANPIPTITVNNATVCAGTPATLTAGGATSYTWSDGSSAGSLTASPGTTTPYTVIGLSAGCSGSAIGIITVNPLPVVTVNSPVMCQGLSAVLTASGANSYSWNDATTLNPKTVSPGSTTPYTVVGTSAGCTGSAISTVTVTQLPVITVNSTTICAGASSTLTANGGATYVWSTGAAGNTITVSPATTTPYTVSDNTAGCSGSAIATVTVNSPSVVTVNSATICEGQSVTLTASGAGSYAWSTGSVSNPLIVSPTTPTSYTVTGNPGGCSGSAVATITVNPLPVVTATSASVCEGLSTTLTAAGATTYVWSNGDVTASTTVSPTNNTAYTVTGANASGCSSTAVGAVTLFSTPTADFSFDPDPAGVMNPVITFTDLSSSDVNSWNWTFGDEDTIPSNEQNPVHTYPPVEKAYTVTLNVLNAGACPNSASHTVVIGSEFTFFIPNAFSPNDDDVNDVFGASGGGIVKFQLSIFDRWGNQVFNADEISKTWDGKVGSGAEVLQRDVYVWKVNLTDVFKKEHDFFGTVTIMQ